MAFMKRKKIKSRCNVNKIIKSEAKSAHDDKLPTFMVRKETIKDIHKHCISIWIGSSAEGMFVNNPSLGFMPIDVLSENPNLIRSGTLTLVQTNNRYFAITCDHVIKILEEENRKKMDEWVELGYVEEERAREYPYAHFKLYCITNTYIDLSSFTFKQPFAQYPESQPDIRIAEITEEVLTKMIKKAINLDKNSVVPNNLTFGIAVGFPETLKAKREVGGGHVFSMPNLEVTAQLHSQPQGRFNLHSKVKEEIDRNFSGMSGGPIFWHQGRGYNILGIVFESPNNNHSTFEKNEIMIRGEYASPETIKGWVKDLFPIL
jgi:hypothetical protein